MSDVCLAVNALFRAVCECKMNCDKKNLKWQLQFFTDLTHNKRALINSLALYEYYATCNVVITSDMLALMREFLLTYLGKYEEPNFNDVFINYANKTLKFVFASYERSSYTDNTSEIIKQVELDIAAVYQNNVFNIINQIIDQIPQPWDPIIVQIKNIQKYFKTGNMISKYNETLLGN